MFIIYFKQLVMVGTLDISTVLLVCEGVFLSVLIVFMLEEWLILERSVARQ